MKRTFLSAIITTVVALTLAGFPARRSAADDDANDVQIEIEAPLEAADCAATPPTITVLGLSIDVSTASIDASGASTSTPTASATPATGADDGGRRRGGGNSSQTTPSCYYYCTPPAAQVPAGCAALVVGQTVEVRLASDSVPLVAAEVKQDASSNHNVQLQAPLQAFDTTAQTITVLSLSIDVSGAGLEGADDDSNDGHSQSIDLTHLMVGQFVEVVLASSTAPLVATDVEVKNFANQLDVDVTDPAGNRVGDVDDDVDVDVQQKVPGQNTSSTPSGTSEPTVLHFHTGSNGRFVLRGLATRRATIFVTRVHDGITYVGRRTVPVKGNALRSLRVHLRPAAAR